jgi:hypothetical protein
MQSEGVVLDKSWQPQKCYMAVWSRVHTLSVPDIIAVVVKGTITDM